jgi:hypothetical protein
MANKLESPDLFNPMTFWTDMGLRGLEMALSSTQNISEGVDRLTRAGASAAASEQVETPTAAAGTPIDSATSSGLALAAQMQQITVDLMSRMWQQWMSAFGTLASLGGRSFGESAGRQAPWLGVLRDGLLPGVEFEPGSARTRSAGSTRHQGGSRRKDHAETAFVEHALAKAEPRRRSSGGRAKAKSRSRGS